MKSSTNQTSLEGGTEHGREAWSEQENTSSTQHHTTPRTFEALALTGVALLDPEGTATGQSHGSLHAPIT